MMPMLPMLLIAAAAQAASSAPAVRKCEGPPVLMVVAGPTHDGARMRAYAEAIGKSGLYQKLGGYYLNAPRPVAVFEGDPPKNLTTLIVRFPCLANAEAFWNSRVYQEQIRPMRLGPSAGDYLVTVYPEAPLRQDVAGKVGSSAYLDQFDAGGIELAKAASVSIPDRSLAAREILQRAVNVAGGEAWLNPKTLVMSGRAMFWGPDSAVPRSTADDYRMWRVFEPNRSAAHGAEGKVLIRARAGDKTLFEAGYDGATTWTERGITPKAEADAYWASNFGFGIIRHAQKPGFKLDRVGDDEQGGHPLYKLRLSDPQGGQTLFGIDQQSFAIRTMEFMTPRGWHKRVYEDFVELKNPRWLQARKVTLYYNGVKQNEVYWQDVKVNAPLDEAMFQYRGK
jgi:uncharacterized protein (DUF1330 family)